MASLIPHEKNELSLFLQGLLSEGRKWRAVWDKGWGGNVAALRNETRFTADIEPMFFAPIVAPAVKRSAGMLVENKPVFDIKVRRKGLYNTAEVLKKIAMASWDEHGIQMHLEELAYYLGAFGSGFFKIIYDEHADYGEGDISIATVDPRNMYIDPSVTKAQDVSNPEICQYLCEEYVVPIAWIKKRFPKTADEVKATAVATFQTEEQTRQYSWYKRMIERFRNKDQPTDSAIPRVLVREWYINDPEVEGGRRIFQSGDSTILNPDEKEQHNPYFDGMWPYEMLDNEPDLDHPWGHAEVSAIKKLEEAINRVGHHYIRFVVRNVPWNIVDANSVAPETVQDLKELEEVIVEKAAGKQVQRIPAQAPGSSSADFMRLARGLVDDIMGFADSSGGVGKGRNEVRSLPQFEGLQQSMQTLIRAKARRLEAMIERVGMKLISRYFQYYTDDRIMAYVDQGEIKEYELEKDKLREEIIEMALAAVAMQDAKEAKEAIDAGEPIPEDSPSIDERADAIQRAVRGAWKLFRFKIIPFSSLSQTKMQRTMMLEQMATGGLIPQSMVLKEAGFDNPTELFQEGVKERAWAASIYQQYGVPPPGPPPKGGKK